MLAYCTLVCAAVANAGEEDEVFSYDLASQRARACLFTGTEPVPNRKAISMGFMSLALTMSLGSVVPALAAHLTIDDVRNTAFDKGIVKIEEVKLDDGMWKVEGVDVHEIKMKVDAGSGEIVKLKRDD
jgi:hypothetical protein